MVNDQIDRLPPDMQIAVKHALMTLAASQVIPNYCDEMVRRLVVGDPDEDDRGILDEIRTTRQKIATLREFQELGEQYEKEMKDAR